MQEAVVRITRGPTTVAEQLSGLSLASRTTSGRSPGATTYPLRIAYALGAAISAISIPIELFMKFLRFPNCKLRRARPARDSENRGSKSYHSWLAARFPVVDRFRYAAGTLMKRDLSSEAAAARGLFDRMRFVEAYTIYRRVYNGLPFHSQPLHARHISAFIRVLYATGRRREVDFYHRQLADVYARRPSV